jgi:hypothetical protein
VIRVDQFALDPRVLLQRPNPFARRP